MIMSRFYKPSSLSNKRIDYSKFLYLNLIIVSSVAFYIFASTISLADAQNATNSTEINTLFETAITLFDQQKYDEAIQNYDKILGIDPNNVDALYNKALVFYDQQKYDEAIQYLDKVLAIDPNDVDALNGKGAIFYDQQKYDQSSQNYDKVLAIDPNNVEAQDGKAQILAESIL
jgi:tetratricopeptide (TPR) repeat protein